jgi:hypothetical protein
MLPGPVHSTEYVGCRQIKSRDHFNATHAFSLEEF